MADSTVRVQIKLKKSSKRVIKDMTNTLLEVKALLNKNLEILQKEFKLVEDKE